MKPRCGAYAEPLIALVALLSVGLSSAACREPVATPRPGTSKGSPISLAANSGSYAVVTVSQLAGMLAAKHFTMINVHTPYEGDLPQTVLDIPFDRVADSLDRLPAKDAPLLIYCRSGPMSMEATLTLTRLGYSQVMVLEGGFRAWKAAGMEMVVSQPQPRLGAGSR